MTTDDLELEERRLQVVDAYAEQHNRVPVSILAPTLADMRALIAELRVYRRLHPHLTREDKEEVARARTH